MDISYIEGVIEAILFASGDSVSLEKIADIIEQDKKTTKAIINNMIDSYKSNNRGLMLREINGRYQLFTKPEHFERIKRLNITRKSNALSQSAMETLSIIAYTQPVTKAKIEKIRGVSCDGVLSTLQDKNLIKDAGRMDAPGKPRLYETTDEFLRAFGFKNIGELPRVEFNELENSYLEKPMD